MTDAESARYRRRRALASQAFALLCLFATALCVLVLAACNANQARIVRNLGSGVTVEGAAVGTVATVTRDPDDDLVDGLFTATPLLVPGLAMWIGGQIALAVHE